MHSTESIFSDSGSGRFVPNRAIVIGAGAGGPQALAKILPDLPSDLPAAVIVVQRMRSGFTRVLAEQLSHTCALPVHEPLDGHPLLASRVILVPANCALTVRKTEPTEPAGYHIDLEDVSKNSEKLIARTNETMISVARVFGSNAIGVLLTGVGEDGAEGMTSIARADGFTIAQDESSSVVFDQPSSAIRGDAAREVLPLWRVASRLVELVIGDRNAAVA